MMAIDPLAGLQGSHQVTGPGRAPATRDQSLSAIELEPVPLLILSMAPEHTAPLLEVLTMDDLECFLGRQGTVGHERPASGCMAGIACPEPQSRSTLRRILGRLQPCAMICIGMDTLDCFEQQHCRAVARYSDGVRIIDLEAGRNADIYRADSAVVAATGKAIRLIGIGDPRRYAWHDEWPRVVLSVQVALGDLRTP